MEDAAVLVHAPRQQHVAARVGDGQALDELVLDLGGRHPLQARQPELLGQGLTHLPVGAVLESHQRLTHPLVFEVLYRQRLGQALGRGETTLDQDLP